MRLNKKAHEILLFPSVKRGIENILTIIFILNNKPHPHNFSEVIRSVLECQLFNSTSSLSNLLGSNKIKNCRRQKATLQTMPTNRQFLFLLPLQESKFLF